VYIGLNTLRGTNKNLNRVLDLLTKVLPKALASWQGKPWQEGLGTRQAGAQLSVLCVSKSGVVLALGAFYELP